MPNSNGSLVITMKLKTKYRLYAAVMFCIGKTNYVNKICILFKDLLPYVISDCIVGGTSVCHVVITKGRAIKM
jgi:hypothetical protein